MAVQNEKLRVLREETGQNTEAKVYERAYTYVSRAFDSLCSHLLMLAQSSRPAGNPKQNRILDT